MTSVKLGVEVVSADDLFPKYGRGSSSTLVELYFDGQKYRTSINVSPVWNEQFFFNISDPANLHNLYLDACVYNAQKGIHRKSLLGKVRLGETSFVPCADALVSHYPLEKRSVFSRVKGKLGLKVYLTDDPSVRSSSEPLPSKDPFPSSDMQQLQPQVQNSGPAPTSSSESNKETSHTNYHVPKQDHLQQQPQQSVTSTSGHEVEYSGDEMEAESPMLIRIDSGSSERSMNSNLKESTPLYGEEQVVGGRTIHEEEPSSTYDLVERMQYLYVRVVKARYVSTIDVSGRLDRYVEVRVGNHRGVTTHWWKKEDPIWNDVFAFSGEWMQATYVDVVVKDNNLVKDGDIVGTVRFDINVIPKRVPPDSPLVPQWYQLEDKKGNKTKGEVMLAVWIGIQADEAFPDAWYSDAASPAVDASIAARTNIRSRVYHAPRMWYVRVNVIEMQDFIVSDKTRFPDVSVRVQIGNYVLKTKFTQVRESNPVWNEDLIFVAAEPLEERLALSVLDHVGPNNYIVIGGLDIPLKAIPKRTNMRPINAVWFDLEKPEDVDHQWERLPSQISLRLCLEGGYHVLDESTWYCSDFRPTAEELWTPAIGILELGILSAEGMLPMKLRNQRATLDSYCVAKYGHKWIRTRTIVDSLRPMFNEQYTWEVYDLATVITVGMFDNCSIGEKGPSGGKDRWIGKVRIRLSTLETGRVYTHWHPFLVLHPTGLKKMGELQLAIRFSCTSLVSMLHMYSRPLMPKMHYVRPLSVIQVDYLRYQAVNIVAAKLSRADPPMRKEVVEYMTDAVSPMWSMRKSKVAFFRLMSVISSLLALMKWLGDVCAWKNPVTTVLVHMLFLGLVFFPSLILPIVCWCTFLIGLSNYRYRSRHPPHMDTRLSCADSVHPDELDEEFDTFPTSKHPDVVQMRYDRLRSVAGRIQTVASDIATQGERVQSLFSWRDPRPSAIFVIFCLLAGIVFWVTPLQIIIVIAGFYLMRHPRLRYGLPSAVRNFFLRLPARTDSLL